MVCKWTEKLESSSVLTTVKIAQLLKVPVIKARHQISFLFFLKDILGKYFW